MPKTKTFRIPYATVLHIATDKNPGLNTAAALEQYRETNNAIIKHSDSRPKVFLAQIAGRIALELHQIYTFRKN